MSKRSTATIPYRQKEQIKLAIAHLCNNHDPVYVLIFEVMVLTGLRVSDVCGLRYDKNIRKELIVIDESKGTLMAKSKARNRVLTRAKETILALAETKEKIAEIMTTPIREIYDLVPEGLKSIVDRDIEEALKNITPKHRECKIPEYLYKKIMSRKRKFKGEDGGFLFAANCVKWAKCKNPKPMNRKTVWAVMHTIGEKHNFDFATNCHQLRKTYAVMLYESSGNNGSLVIADIGWSDDKYLQTYLAIDEDKRKAEVTKMHNNFLN